MSNEFAVFESMLLSELDRYFNAEIACCDHCCDDFLESWPWADKADDYDFQRRSIDLQWFYDTGRMRDVWTEAEYWALMGEMECPRCCSPLAGNIWAYELPFDVPRNIESTIYEVSELANKTPFLLLENDFCRKIHAAIKETEKHINPVQVEHSLYRARAKHQNPKPIISDFDFPPPQFVSEGRYNHAGNPALYLASDIETCKAETRNCDVLILEFMLKAPLKIFDLTSDFDEPANYTDLLKCLTYSALVSAHQTEQGLYKPHYTVSRFVADCVKSAGFDAIKYPSTRSAYGAFNLVVVNQSLRLEHHASVIRFIDL